MKSLLFVSVAAMLALALAGCSADRTVLVNDRGERITCEASFYGAGPNLIMSSQQNDCVRDAETRGYHVESK
jgi:uncharacterized protein YcfL